MIDKFVEITHTSWWTRIAQSLSGIIFGFLLVIGSFVLIFWNEGRSVERIKVLSQGRDIVISVSNDTVDPQNNGKLVHVVGEATTPDILNDALFGVKENALNIKRKVEMYQWKETEDIETKNQMGGGETTITTYNYEKVWSEFLIPSARFKQKEGHQNPATLPYKTTQFTAQNVTIGAFKITKPFIQQLNSFDDYSLTQSNFDKMNPELKKQFTLNGTQYFYGDPTNPDIGAVRITYGIIQPGSMTVIGKQDNGIIQPYKIKNGSISLIKQGALDSDSMFTEAENENSLITWALRLASFLLMLLGFVLMLNIIRVLSDVVPIFGAIVGAGVGLITTVLTLTVFTFVTAFSWILVRPLIGISLLVISLALFLGAYSKIKSQIKMVLKRDSFKFINHDAPANLNE